MSKLKTDKIWLALGDFYEMFPDDERIYWTTFWETYADITADLWGLAFQVDRGKSVLSAPEVDERREVLVKFSNLTTAVDARFRFVTLYVNDNDQWILRGFVPRELRTFKTSDLPASGLIRIGVDLIGYDNVNVTPVDDDDRVLEATFTLGQEPPHAYADVPEFCDSFVTQTLTLRLRVAHAPGDTIVDAVGSGTVNGSGVLDLSDERVEYESVSVLGDRYVFQLATSYQAPDAEVEQLRFAHGLNAPITVYRHDVQRWTQTLSGHARITAEAGARVVIDNLPSPLAGHGELTGVYQLQNNVDFDVATAVDLRTWATPTVDGSAKRVVLRAVIGQKKYVAGLETRRSALGITTHWLISGAEGAETSTALDALPDTQFELRITRTASVLECSYRPVGEHAYQVLGSSLSVTGSRATFDLVVDDPNTASASVVVFDEVVRRLGDVVGSQRPEDYFSATTTYAHGYDIDQKITTAAELWDRPRLRTETLVTTREVTGGQIIYGRGEGENFQAQGVPTPAGTLTIGGVSMVYERVTRTGDEFAFRLRAAKIDPNLLPMSAGTAMTASTRQLRQETDYRLTGDGGIEFKELPTRDRMWAPVAYVDVQRLQKTFGTILDLKAAVSTRAYAARVRGTWAALMLGPAVANVHSGLQLAMGLPVAQEAGTVTEITDYRDEVGRLVKRTMTILNAQLGAFVHELNPDLYPYIDWSSSLGDAVIKFQPLTNGVEVLDAIIDDTFYTRFPGGLNEVERFNTLGVFVAIEALNEDASVDDALRFALRIKPTYTKLVMRFLLTSGDEDLSQVLDDDLALAIRPWTCEDLEMPEGPAPSDWQQILRLGDGHKLGQHKFLGGSWQWHYVTIGDYRRQGPYDQGSAVAGGDIFEGRGGFEYIDFDSAPTAFTASVTGDVFTIDGGYSFVAGDVGKHVAFAGLKIKIAAILSLVSVRLERETTAATAFDWQLRDYGFHVSDVGKDIYVHNHPSHLGPLQIAAVLDRGRVRVLHTFVTAIVNQAWEIRAYGTLGAGLRLGEIYAAKCLPPAAHEPNEYVDDVEIVVYVATEV